jgi:sulfate-transporting ATPase
LFSIFDALTPINMVTQAVLGGVGYVTGPFVGSQGNPGTITSRAVENIGGISAYQYLTVGLALLTILTLLTAPNGLVPLNSDQLARLVRRVRGVSDSQSRQQPIRVRESTTRTTRQQEAFLQVSDLSVRLGGVQALDGVTISLHGGQILGVIGPNGAGKTTLIDAICGFVRATGGSVRLDGEDLKSYGPRRRSGLGIGRSFQSLELFEDLTVYENLVAACDEWSSWRWLWEPLKPGSPALNPIGVAAATDLGVSDPVMLSEYPGELSHGTRRLLAIARVVATGPRVLLLDEPAAGLDVRERNELAEKIRSLAAEQGMAIILVEHDIDLVCSISDTVVALDRGEIICEGEPSAVRTDPKVVVSYLGSDEESHLPSTMDSRP